MKENIVQAVEVLRGAKAEIAPLLAETPNLSIRANNALDSLINFFSHTAGIAIQMNGGTTESFPPITQFMGEPIARAKEVKPEDLKLGETEKEIFKAKVEALYAEFPLLENEEILKGGSIESMVLRGVAKMAGVEDYKDAELTYDFLDAIRAGMAAKAEINAAVSTAKKNAKNPKDEGTGK